MNKTAFLRLCCAALLLVLVAACGAPAAPAVPTTEPAQAPTAAPSTQVPTPATTVCSALQPAIAAALGVDLAADEAPFKDWKSGKEFPSCRLTATGTGVNFATPFDTMQELKGVFAAQGWSEEQSYAADGPTGTGLGFRKGDLFCFAMVEWTPSPDADCPEDQPIEACDLTPEQQLYTITIQGVQGL